MKTIGQRVRERRLELKMNQAQLAEGVCTPSAISQLEADKFYPTVKMISGLAEKLKLTPNDLVMCSGANLDTEVLLKMADFYERTQQYAECLTLLGKLENPVYITEEQQYKTQLIKSAVLYKAQDTPTQAIEAVKDLLAKIEFVDGYERLTVESYNKLGAYYLKVPNYSKAYVAYLRGHNIASKLSDKDELYAKICYNLGLTCNYLGYVAEAVKYLTDAMELYSKMSNLKSLALTLFDLGIACTLREDWHEGEKYVQEAIILLNAAEVLTLANRAREYHAFIYISKEDIHQAIDILTDCMNEAIELRDMSSVPYYYARIASLCIDAGEIDKAEECLNAAQTVFNKHNGNEVSGDYAYVCRVVGQLYIVKQDYQNGIFYCLKSAELFDKIDLLADSIQSLQLVADTHKLLGNYAEATAVYEQMMERTVKRRLGVKL